MHFLFFLAEDVTCFIHVITPGVIEVILIVSLCLF